MPRQRHQNYVYMGPYDQNNNEQRRHGFNYGYDQYGPHRGDRYYVNGHRLSFIRRDDGSFDIYGPDGLYRVHAIHTRHAPRHGPYEVRRFIRTIQVAAGEPSRNNRSDDVCFICDDVMGNSSNPCIHLCDGGNQTNQNNQTGESPSTSSQEKQKKPTLHGKLEQILADIKSNVAERTMDTDVTEELDEILNARVQEMSNLYRDCEMLAQHLRTSTDDLEKKSNKLSERESAVKKSEERLEREKKKFQEEKNKEREETKRLWQQLRDELTRMEEVHKIQESRVVLDIGGRKATTSTLTLTQDNSSMLGAMFSGRHELKREADGSIFIDRDGTHIRYILNYLRDGGLSVDTLPRNKQALKEIRNEAIFYQIHGLVQVCEKLMGERT